MAKEHWIYIMFLIIGVFLFIIALVAGDIGKQARWRDNLLVVKTEDSVFVLDENMKCVSKRGR